MGSKNSRTQCIKQAEEIFSSECKANYHTPVCMKLLADAYTKCDKLHNTEYSTPEPVVPTVSRVEYVHVYVPRDRSHRDRSHRDRDIRQRSDGPY